jgi:hypothetical protein
VGLLDEGTGTDLLQSVTDNVRYHAGPSTRFGKRRSAGLRVHRRERSVQRSRATLTPTLASAAKHGLPTSASRRLHAGGNRGRPLRAAAELSSVRFARPRDGGGA